MFPRNIRFLYKTLIYCKYFIFLQHVAKSTIPKNTKQLFKFISILFVISHTNNCKQLFKMLYQCGYNEFYQLCDKSNNQSTYKTPVISPCIKSSLDISSLLSYSVFGNHSVIINRENKIYAIGDNRDNRICGSLPKTILTRLRVAI